jgi:anti-sigma factor RsiW
MGFEPKSCDDRIVDRFRDGELEDNERLRIASHIENCPHCRQHLEQTDRLGQTISRHFAERSLDEVAAARLAATTMRRLRQRPSPFFRRLADGLTRKKIWFPAAATAFVLMAAIFTAQWEKVPERSAPSAIIHSFRADTTSVMIMETQNKRQTVIWFTEES